MRPRLLHSSWLISALAAVAEPVGSAPSTAGAVLPVRIVDSRCNLQINGALCRVGTAVVQVTGKGAAPASGMSGVVLNAAVVSQQGAGYSTVWSGIDRTATSNLNFQAGQNIPKSTILPATKTWVTERICPIRQPPGGLQHCPLVPSEKGRESWAFC
jgi:hypothetical protein